MPIFNIPSCPYIRNPYLKIAKKGDLPLFFGAVFNSKNPCFFRSANVPELSSGERKIVPGRNLATQEAPGSTSLYNSGFEERRSGREYGKKIAWFLCLR